MKKLDFSTVELASAIRNQLKINREMLANGREAKNLPVIVFSEKVDSIADARFVFSSLLDYENIKVQRLERFDGQDDIPTQLLAIDLDELSLLAIAGDSLYVLDKNFYQVDYPKKGIFTLSKKKGRFNTAQYK